MASDDFYVINSWMIDDLGLSGTELQCFAIIWSLSRGKKQMYIAGNSHLVKMTKMTEHTIITTLKSLCEKGYIKKIPTKVNNVARNYYKAITKGCKNFSDEESQNDKRDCNNYSGTTEKSSAPNKESNKESNNKENKSLSNDKQKDDDFENFWKKYHQGSKQVALKRWNAMSTKDQELAYDMIDDYLIYCKRSKIRKKDVATFLYNKCYKDDYKNIIPDYYQEQPADNERMIKFKRYMVSRFADLIFHRNPLTFEQASELLDKWGTDQFEWAMDKLAKRDIHQYYSINQGVLDILENDNEI